MPVVPDHETSVALSAASEVEVGAVVPEDTGVVDTVVQAVRDLIVRDVERKHVLDVCYPFVGVQVFDVGSSLVVCVVFVHWLNKKSPLTGLASFGRIVA